MCRHPSSRVLPRAGEGEDEEDMDFLLVHGRLKHPTSLQ